MDKVRAFHSCCIIQVSAQNTNAMGTEAVRAFHRRSAAELEYVPARSGQLRVDKVYSVNTQTIFTTVQIRE